MTLQVGQNQHLVTAGRATQETPKGGTLVTASAGTQVTPVRKMRSYKPRARRCASCKQSFTPKVGHGRFCSDKCRKKDYRTRQAKLIKSKPAKPLMELVMCLHCRNNFFAEAGKGALYCSPAHKTAAWRARRQATVTAIVLDRSMVEGRTISLEEAEQALQVAGLSKLTKYLQRQGYVYNQQERAWVGAIL